MNDSELLKISLLVSTIGLIMLFAISSYSQPPLVKISEITYDDVGGYVIVNGKIIKKSVHRDGHIFLDIADETGKMKVVIFSGTANTIKNETLSCLKVGNTLNVKGKVDEYRGALEMVPKDGVDVECQ
ncbi:MAG: exodeoxyribonuclease VII large subunit [Candidatus Hydrothermarchaeales archaeon]